MVIFRCPYCGFETDNAEAFLLHYNWDIPPAPPNRLYGKVYLDGQVVTEGTITPVCIEVGAPTDNPVEIREDRIYVLDIPSRHGCFNCVGKTFKFILTLPDGRQFESKEVYKILEIGALKRLCLHFGKYEKIAEIEKIEVKELTSGKTYTVSKGGTVTVGEGRVRITITVRNVTDISQTLSAALLLNYKAPWIERSISVAPYTSGSAYWDVELREGTNTVNIIAEDDEAAFQINYEEVPRIEPKASIVKDLSRYPDGLGGIIYNGQVLEPNKEHPIPKGSKVEYFAMAQNVGGSGNIWIRLLVNGVEVDRAEGGSPAISGTITVNADMELKFEAGHGDVKDDEWGC